MELQQLLVCIIVYVSGILGSYIHTYPPTIYTKNVCAPVCDKPCIFGKVTDYKGCLLCKCRTRGQPPACRQPKKVGPCEALIPRYFYNKKNGKCELFQWGGCDPNANNFKTLKNCVNTCGYCPKRVCKRSCPNGYKRNRRGCETCRCNLKPSQSSGCNVQRDKGKCGPPQIRYFYNQRTGKCQKFLWGGCKENSNNFKSLRECKGVCVCGPVCAIFCKYGNIPDERGCPTCSCRPRPCPVIKCKNNRCKERVLDNIGCETCQCKRCLEPKKIGPCRARKPRYYFNQSSGKCELFYWGGCQANGNNFALKWFCKKYCEG